MSDYHVDPHGVFLEVPYPLLSAWTSGGYTWAAPHPREHPVMFEAWTKAKLLFAALSPQDGQP